MRWVKYVVFGFICTVLIPIAIYLTEDRLKTMCNPWCLQRLELAELLALTFLALFFLMLAATTRD